MKKTARMVLHFLFPSRPNLNLCSRDSCPYTDKGCMDSREERSRGGPPPDRPDPTSESKVGSTLDLTRIAPSILLRRGLVSNPCSNRRSTPC
ncbi:hypothetical protein ACS0TY_018654 [Phlomoides rotata]